MIENPSFYLEGVVKEKNQTQDFEGPLSLILMLLSKNKIEIRDISISMILDQYLEYLEKMQSMDLEIASEFVQMASHLLYIKTRTLLKTDDEPVSELELLMASLEQLKSKDTLSAIQKLVPQLKEASETGMLYYTKLPEPVVKVQQDYEYRHEPVELLKALAGVYSRGVKAKERDFSFAPAIPQPIIYSVKDKGRELLSLLSQHSRSLDELYGRCSSRSELVATFVAVLELCSMGTVLVQKSEGGYSVELCSDVDIEDIVERISD